MSLQLRTRVSHLPLSADKGMVASLELQANLSDISLTVRCGGGGLTYQVVEVCRGRLCRSLAGVHTCYLSDHCISGLQRSMTSNIKTSLTALETCKRWAQHPAQ